MNYQWSKNPQALVDPINKAMVALVAAVCLGSSLWYSKEGDRGTGGILGFVGGLQIWAAFQTGQAQKQL
jgi:hypothetical protein